MLSAGQVIFLVLDLILKWIKNSFHTILVDQVWKGTHVGTRP